MSARRSPQSVPVTLQVGVGSRCRLTIAIVRAAKARARIVALVSYGSATEVWPPDEIALSSSACTQRSIRCGAALASRLDPLTKLSSLLNGTSVPDPEPVSCSCDPGNWACGRYHPETSAKDISARISFSPGAAIAPWLASWMRGARLLQSKELRRFWSRLLILCCDPTTVAYLCSPNATLQACLHTATLLSGSQTSFNRFIGDRRPLNSRERSIRHAHLPCCPRLRRMIFGKSETVQTVFTCTRFLLNEWQNRRLVLESPGVGSLTSPMKIWVL